MPITEKQTNPISVSSVYGPVHSWRVGNSLGIDLICETSVCSFNCIYCQLGNIQRHTNERRLFVTTEKVMDDLAKSNWEPSDIITFSGSGEPTLAKNIGEVIRAIKEFTGKPTVVLTNGTTLGDSSVRKAISASDKVFVKLDAADESTFTKINRPVEGLTLSKIISWIKNFKKEYSGYLGIQCMFLPINLKDMMPFVDALNLIDPDEVQLNTPKRPYPDRWYLPSRGSHGEVPYKAKSLKTISASQAITLEELFREKTNLKIVNVFPSE